MYGFLYPSIEISNIEIYFVLLSKYADSQDTIFWKHIKRSGTEA